MDKVLGFVGAVLLVGCSAGVSGEDGSGREPSPPRDETNVTSSATTRVAGSESQKADCPLDLPSVARPNDYHSTITVSGGNWGDWGCLSMCPEGSFAYEASIRSLTSQGSNIDDVSVTALDISCLDRATGQFTGYRMDHEFSLNNSANGWYNPGVCAWPNKPLVGGRMLLEAPVGSSADDTSTNGLKISCRGDNNEIDLPRATSFGTWRSKVTCPSGTAVCGIATRMEGTALVGSRDDTAINGLRYACCNFPL
jgi:Vitelline membrane outer layer protein I (VOMI)